MAVYTPLDYIIAFIILIILLEFSEKVIFRKIKFDDKFVIASIPIIIFALSIRLLADAGVYEKSDYWSVTPGIYVLAFAFGFISYFAGYILKKEEYWKIAIAIETPFALYFFIKLLSEIGSFKNILLPLPLALALTAFAYFVFIKNSEKLNKKENAAIVFAHMLDASSSFIGINYFGFGEEHILPELFINLAGGNAVILIPLKLTVVLLALYVLEVYGGADKGEDGSEEGKGEEREGEQDLYYKMIKFIFFIIGIGPGIRNSTLLGL